MSRRLPNAVGNRLTIPQTAVWDQSDELTLAIWVKLDSYGNYDVIMGRWYEPGGNRIWCLEFDSGTSGGGGWRFDTSSIGAFNSSNTVSATVPVPVGRWAHLAAVHDPAASTSTVFLNGKVAGRNTSVEPALYNATQDAWIGYSNFAGGDQKLNGLVAQASMWTSVLSAAEIRALSLGVTADRIRPAKLAFFYPLDDWMSGGSARDLGRFASHATMVGTVTLDGQNPSLIWTPDQPAYAEIVTGPPPPPVIVPPTEPEPEPEPPPVYVEPRDGEWFSAEWQQEMLV